MKIRPVKIGSICLDGKHIFIQSMLSVPSADAAGNVAQAKALEAAGCEIVRVSVPTKEDVRLIEAIKSEISIPLVADIHFDYRIALECAAAGVDKIRINPGNIGAEDRVKAVVDACKAKNIPIRIGVNSGSLEKEILAKYGSPTPEALAESAVQSAAMLERHDFNDIVISIKSSTVQTMIAANRLVRQKLPYPLHLGVTEAGTERLGMIKSSVGIGSLLCDGIGETIRVSLTADPVREIYAAKDLLTVLGLRKGVKIVSCPTCGRTKIDLIGLANKVEELVRDMDDDITVAVMGCIVNGPGEAREADVGIAGGDGCAIIFRKGEVIRKVEETQAFEALLAEIESIRKGTK